MMPLFPSHPPFWKSKEPQHTWVWGRKEIFAWNWVSVSPFFMPRVFSGAGYVRTVLHYTILPNAFLNDSCALKSFPKVNWWRPEGVGQLSPRTHFSYCVMAWPDVFEVRAMILPPWGSISYRGSLGPSCPWGGRCCDQFKPFCNHIRPLPPALSPVLPSWVEDVWRKSSQSAYVLNSLFCNHVFRVPLRWNGLFLKCW